MIRSSDGNINGYVFVRDIEEGLACQPFYADTKDTAEQLLLKILENDSKSKIQFSVPIKNENIFSLLTEYFQPNYRTSGNTSLTKGILYKLDLDKIFSMLDYSTSICWLNKYSTVE